MLNGNIPLVEADPDVYELVLKEQRRQREGLELIASENFASQAVLEALGTCFTNKYSEGLPGRRYYGGNEFTDELERLCQKRALELFGLDSNVWGVNVQPYSGSIANLAVYTALLGAHGRLMGLDLPSGGHLTHGYQTASKKISAASIFFESMPYQVDQNTGYVDYDTLEQNAKLFKPNLIIAGGSAYPRDWDYKRMKAIANIHNNCYLMVDMAHFSGLVVGKVQNNPFEYADIVTTTTHKTLKGPRGAMIFFKKRINEENIEKKINDAVFPGLQGGPHQNKIAAIAVALKEAHTAEYRAYAKQVVKNAKRLAQCLQKKGYTIRTGGTDNHIVLWDVRPLGLTGSKMEKVLETMNISVNKNAIYGDKSAMNPGGVRLGTPAVTARGMVEKDMEIIADLLETAVQIALEIQKDKGKLLKNFLPALHNHEVLLEIREQVRDFAKLFRMPGSIND